MASRRRSGQVQLGVVATQRRLALNLLALRGTFIFASCQRLLMSRGIVRHYLLASARMPTICKDEPTDRSVNFSEIPMMQRGIPRITRREKSTMRFQFWSP